MQTLIIEDETPAANRLKKILQEIDPGITVLGVCDSIDSSVKWLENNPAPDLILMDIELSDGKSFDIFNRMQVQSPVIFITAYDEFAIKAIKFSAIDYLLKPISKGELAVALLKVKNLASSKTTQQPDISVLKEFISNAAAGKKPKKLAVSNVNSTSFVELDKIVRLEASSNYTHIILDDKKQLVASRTLKEYEELLSEYGFFRIHNTHLINLSFVEKYIKGEGGFILMKDGASIEVSRLKKKDLLTALSLS